jgi:cytochrome b6-f complex iron-sulfur subunit
MNRKEFLKSMGLSGAALLAVYCSGCSLSPNVNFNTPSTSVDFTLDLSQSAYNSLNTDGGYVITNGVVVARTTSGQYVAVTQICSHEGQPNVTYVKSSNIFYCNVHGAQYDTSGKGLNSNGRNGLATYKTSLNGTLLRVYS